MAREGLMDDSGIDFEFECSATMSCECEECSKKDLCATYEEMVIEEAEQESELEEWNKYYYDTRL